MNAPSNYSEFLSILLEKYEPFAYEIDQHNALYGKGRHQNWAVRQSLRFYHTYSSCLPYLSEGNTVVDIGAYPGSFLKILKLVHSSPLHLIAAGMPVDSAFPEDMAKLGINFVPCDLDTALPTSYPTMINIPASSVDVVVCTEMIEHLYTVKQLMTEIHRMLRPGGVAYISTNNVAYLPGILRLFYGQSNLDVDLMHTSALVETEWRGHVRFYSLSQLIGLTRIFDLQPIVHGYYQMRAPRAVVSQTAQLRWFASRLMDGALSLFPIYQSHIFVLARKKI